MFAKSTITSLVFVALLLVGHCAVTSAQSIDFSMTPIELEPGSTNQVQLPFDLPAAGIVQLQLVEVVNGNWSVVDNPWVSVEAGANSATFTIVVPADATLSGDYLWQGILYNSGWEKLFDDVLVNVSVGPPQTSQFEVADLPLSLASGETHSVTAGFISLSGGIVQLSLLDSSGNEVAGDSVSVNAGAGSHTFSIEVPTSETGNGYLWQATVQASDGSEPFNEQSAAVTLVGAAIPNPNGDDPLPPGTWVVDWNDEFTGDAFEVPSKWYPLLAYDPDTYLTSEEKGIRWTGETEGTSQMYSTKNHHWLDGNGSLMLRAVSDKTEQNIHGDRVETAYLMSGYPEAWDNSDPAATVRWGGKFVSPQETPLYISCRVKTNEVVGHSTWFAFWLFSQTRAYNNNPTDGTEVDIIEMAKGPNWLNESFNVAHHWNLTGGSEAKQFNAASNPPAQFFVDVQDDQFHTYGLEWTTERMTCFVDGVPCYTFTENIPSDPVDMMMMLTMEFQVDAWAVNQGDGRVSGPFVSDGPDLRVMSRALVDYVRVYKKTSDSSFLLGDCNLDGEVNFLDIAPFIDLLTSGTYFEQADCNLDGEVNFLDIAAFIAILTAS